jgi:hypothetical protein
MSFPMLSALYSLLSVQAIGSAQPSNRIGNNSFTSCPSMQTPHAEAVNGALEHQGKRSGVSLFSLLAPTQLRIHLDLLAI